MGNGNDTGEGITVSNPFTKISTTTKQLSLESGVECSCEAVSYIGHLIFFATICPFLCFTARLGLCFCRNSFLKALSALVASQYSTN